MKIILFEDNQCHNLHPIGLFRPLFDLYAGSFTLFQLIRQLDLPTRAIIREHFLFDDEDHPRLPTPLDEPHLFLNASIEPDVRSVEKLRNRIAAGDPFISTSGNRVAAALVPAGRQMPEAVTPDDISAHLLELSLPLEQNIFKTIDWPHEVVESHLRLFETNLEKRIADGHFSEERPGVYLGHDVTLSPSVELDSGEGPVVLDSGVTVLPFTYIRGPVFIGRKTRVIEHSSVKSAASIEHGCKIGGEVEMSVIEPHSNKQHTGFLGHSWVGRWVNLGAGTVTSNLKTTYGKVRMAYQGQRVGTGMQFMGSIIGDYTKTAITTSIFTGKIIGVCSMLYGMVTTNVPSFTNYAKTFGQITEINPEQVITTQRRMFERRGVKQTERDTELIRRVYAMTREERKMRDSQITF